MPFADQVAPCALVSQPEASYWALSLSSDHGEMADLNTSRVTCLLYVTDSFRACARDILCMSCRGLPPGIPCTKFIWMLGVARGKPKFLGRSCENNGFVENMAVQ